MVMHPMGSQSVKKSPLRNQSKLRVAKPQPTPGDWKKTVSKNNTKNTWKTNKRTTVDDVGVPSTPFFFVLTPPKNHRKTMRESPPRLMNRHGLKGGAEPFFLFR